MLISISKIYGILFGIVIIGITGTIGAGKGTVVEHLLQHHNFRHYSVRDVLTAELNKRGLPAIRPNMAIVGDELREKYGAGYFVETLLKEAQRDGGNAIIDSIRTIGEINSLREKAKDFYLLAVDADPKVRFDRIIKRNSSTDHVSYDKFLAEELNESCHDELWRMNLPACIAKADYTFFNNSSVDEFFAQVEEVMKKL